ncbi:MBL fold metallo-hydrolase [Nocardiopsis algeriensis]|uniref:Glyoxylase-like metal-dependent hydrolase (Beta-lactamase superfamily II) n=1 Tax=Nocardiopsis algeriensis TaxID=1478215 RepID=A0A841IQJ4_9ACTN|nr:glyoxylase-like metal-dependent hydrolase (beta-lactamase superfamily II) [Nocardiopsis algeriensis]
MSDTSPVVRLRIPGTSLPEEGGLPPESNVWVVGDEESAIVVDAAHDHEAIARGLGDRELMAIVCTHGDADHVGAAAALADLTGTPVLLHPADGRLWEQVHPDREPDAPLLHGEVLVAGGIELRILHTPGHTPGGVCLYAPELGAVFTGDTLLADGPGATARFFSDLPTLAASVRDHLAVLPGETAVHPGRGESATVAEATARLDSWTAGGF